MSSVVIRKATTADAAIVALLARVTFTETFGNAFRDPNDLVDYYNETFSVHKFRDSIGKENNIFWIAFVDELPVGYAKMKKYSPSTHLPNEDKVSQLQKIYVLKDFLSMKIGQKLQDEIVAEARLIGSRYLWLSVLNANERAIGFYKKHGFVVCGELEFDIGKEHFEYFAMKKELNC
jgi:ribosomal protein S18 acetylase RimI-like enzyme